MLCEPPPHRVRRCVMVVVLMVVVVVGAQEEMSVLSSLKHPHIIRLVEIHFVNSIFYLIMVGVVYVWWGEGGGGGRLASTCGSTWKGSRGQVRTCKQGGGARVSRGWVSRGGSGGHMRRLVCPCPCLDWPPLATPPAPAQEFASGGSLVKHIYGHEGRKLPEHEAHRVFMQIATALEYCHRR